MVRSLVIFILLSISTAFAEPQLYLDVMPKTGAQDEEFILSVVIENSSQGAVPSLSGGSDFDIEYLGPRSSTTIINGTVTVEAAHNYRLFPKRSGVLETPGATVTIGGKRLEAAPLKIKITKSDNSPATSDIILRQEISRVKPYVGQQIIHTLSLYSAVPIYDYQFSDQQFDGFWSKSIGDIDKSAANLNNRRFNVFRWVKALFPLRSGQITIPQREIEVKVQSRRRTRGFPFGYRDPFSDPFDSFFGKAQLETKRFQAEKTNVDVRALPQPQEALKLWNTGNVLVGRTSLAVAYDESSIKTGENKTVTVRLTSLGNLNPITTLPLDDSPSYRIYQEGAEEDESFHDSELVMTKTIKFSIVPFKPGRLEISSLELSYFDPETETYEIAAAPPVSFMVSGADLSQSAVAPDAPAAKEQFEKLSTDHPAPPKNDSEAFTPYRKETALERISSQVSLSLSLFVLAVAALIIFLIRLAIAPVKERRKRSAALAEIVSAQDISALYKAVFNFISSAIGSDYSGEPLRAVIKQRVSDSDQLFAVLTLLDRLEAAQFGGTQNQSFSFEDLKAEAIETMQSLSPHKLDSSRYSV